MGQSRIEVVLRRHWRRQCLGGECHLQPLLYYLVLNQARAPYVHDGIPDTQITGSLRGWQDLLAVV